MENVEQLLKRATLPGEWPQWFRNVVDRDAALLKDCCPPSKSDEAWRFGNPAMADLNEFVPAASLPDEIAARLAEKVARSPVGYVEPIASHQVVLVNGSLVSFPSELPDGLTVETLADYIRNDASAQQVLEPQFKSLGMERLVLIRSILSECGVVIKTKPGVRVADPVEIIHLVQGEKSLIAPMTLVLPGESSRVDVLETHTGGEETAILALQRIHVASGASVSYGLFQLMDATSKVIELGEAVLEQDASLDFLSMHGGGRWIRQEIICSLEGRGANANLLSSASLDGARELDQRTYQKHSCPGARSNLLFKNVLRDEAKTTFSGMIRVDHGAHETDAYQRNLNLHLSPKAESNSMPGLEILADGVRCSHGSATAPIDSEHVFYLESRGIPRESAEDMIAQGFLDQVVQVIREKESPASWLPLV